MAEVYAAYSEYTDAQVGRIIDYLEQTGQLDNTPVLYCADNGASGEGSPNGSVNENKFFNGYPDELSENMKLLDKLGSPDTYEHYPTGWAAAFSTPFNGLEEADKNFVLPLDDRTPIEIISTPRPADELPRDRYIHYPGKAPVPESAAVNVRGRSYKILADVEIVSPDCSGVIFAHGSRFGGHSLFLKNLDRDTAREPTS